mmetsp:Transcript_57116/g.185654  ORF Transcript_57116/g.185654 Transcript_57116/m.185654 type:complete len:204 (+) Transcript_57116:388-999(+)
MASRRRLSRPRPRQQHPAPRARTPTSREPRSSTRHGRRRRRPWQGERLACPAACLRRLAVTPKTRREPGPRAPGNCEPPIGAPPWPRRIGQRPSASPQSLCHRRRHKPAQFHARRAPRPESGQGRAAPSPHAVACANGSAPEPGDPIQQRCHRRSPMQGAHQPWEGPKRPGARHPRGRPSRLGSLAPWACAHPTDGCGRPQMQ